MNEKNKKIPICKVDFSVLDYDVVIAQFAGWIQSRASHHVCTANVHTLITSLKDAELYIITKNAALVTMDGEPLRWYANAVHMAGVRERVCGPDLMARCFEHGQDVGWRHYLYGGKEEVIDKLQHRLLEKYPQAIIVGACSPPFKPLTIEEESEIIAQINKSGADLLWVGLGAPKQEKWIARHLSKLQVPVQIGVGAAFDFHAGAIQRAPRFIQRLGLEWLYRMIRDPRLFKRYAMTNLVFLYIFVRDFVKIRLLRIN